MIYTELTKKAVTLAYRAHAGQTDRAGWPYILHPVHIAEQMITEDTCVVALLHDVLEDTDVTLEDMRKEGFTEQQLEAVQLMTHSKNVPYMDYVKKLSGNAVARAVKIGDLKHNMDRSRLSEYTEKDEQRYRKYKEALEQLLKCEEQDKSE